MGRKYAQLAIQIVAVVGVLLLLSKFVIYIVDQREQAVVLQFGKPVRKATEPGLYFKIPFVESVRKLPKTLQFWGDDVGELLPDLPTKDDKKIQLVPWAVWKINDPIAFVTRMRTVENAEKRVAQFVRSSMRDVITQYELADLVRSSDREMKTAQLDIVDDSLPLPIPDDMKTEPEKAAASKIHVVGREKILSQINQDALQRMVASAASDVESSRGIELVDVGISHIDFVQSVRQKTFERWKAERGAISTRNVTEGERLKQVILNATTAEVERIKGDGQRQASETRGKVDAEVIRLYADAITKTGDFYTFVRTLEAYEKSFGDDAQMILTTDNDFLKLLQTLGTAQK